MVLFVVHVHLTLFYCTGDEATASVHSHSSTGYHSGFHSSTTGLHSGSNSSITLAGSSHLTPTHNYTQGNLPTYNTHVGYTQPLNYQQVEDTVYNPPLARSQGYLGYPRATINSAPPTCHTSQFDHVSTPKVSCPMAKVAPYSAQVNRVVAMPTSSSSISADSISYQVNHVIILEYWYNAVLWYADTYTHTRSHYRAQNNSRPTGHFQHVYD